MLDTVKVTFQAQRWDGEMARRANREPNSATFTIPFEDAVVSDTDVIPQDVDIALGMLPRDDSSESDELAVHENAPDWVREWAEESKGPYYIQTEVIE